MPNQKLLDLSTQSSKSNKSFNEEVINNNQKKCQFLRKIVSKVVKVANSSDKTYSIHNLKNCTVRNFKNMKDRIETLDLNTPKSSPKKRASSFLSSSSSSKKQKKSITGSLNVSNMSGIKSLFSESEKESFSDDEPGTKSKLSKDLNSSKSSLGKCASSMSKKRKKSVTSSPNRTWSRIKTPLSETEKESSSEDEVGAKSELHKDMNSSKSSSKQRASRSPKKQNKSVSNSSNTSNLSEIKSPFSESEIELSSKDEAGTKSKLDKDLNSSKSSSKKRASRSHKKQNKSVSNSSNSSTLSEIKSPFSESEIELSSEDEAGTKSSKLDKDFNSSKSSSKKRASRSPKKQNKSVSSTSNTSYLSEIKSPFSESEIELSSEDEVGAKSKLDKDLNSSKSSSKKRTSSSSKKQKESSEDDLTRFKLINDLIKQQKKRLSLSEEAEVHLDDSSSDSILSITDSGVFTLELNKRELRVQECLRRIKKIRQLPNYDLIIKILFKPKKNYNEISLNAPSADRRGENNHWNSFSYVCEQIEQCVLKREWNNLTKLLILLSDAPTSYQPFLLRTTLINILCNPAVETDDTTIEKFLKACYGCQTDYDIGRVLGQLFHVKKDGEEEVIKEEVEDDAGPMSEL